MEIQADLSVCTSVFKNANSLQSLLSSLYQTAGPVSLEVIAVDRSGLVANLLQKEFPQLIVYEDSQEKNPIKALNRGLQLATGRYVSAWDNDVLAKPACLQTLLDFLDETPDVGLAGPKITDAYGKTEPSWQKFPSLLTVLNSLSPFKRSGKHNHDQNLMPFSPDLQDDVEIEWLQSGVHIIRREVLEEIGFFDPSFPWAFAEMDYYQRARKAGWHNFFCPSAEVLHPNPARYHPELRPQDSYSEVARDSFRYLQKNWLPRKNQFQDAGF